MLYINLDVNVCQLIKYSFFLQEAASTAHKNPLNSQAVYGMNKFTDPVAQRQYFQKLNLALEVRSFPQTCPHTKTFNNLDYTDYRNQAETLLYSNATRMLQLRSEELDRVREIDTYTTSNLNEFQMASYTPPPLPPPPPPPHKQEHLTDTRISKAMRSYAHGEVERARTRSKTADEIEAERIKSYNEGASIFKIHKIREFTPDFDRQGGSSGSGKPELAGQRSSMEIIAADKVKQKHESVNAGYYVNHSNGRFLIWEMVEVGEDALTHVCRFSYYKSHTSNRTNSFFWFMIRKPFLKFVLKETHLINVEII